MAAGWGAGGQVRASNPGTVGHAARGSWVLLTPGALCWDQLFWYDEAEVPQALGINLVGSGHLPLAGLGMASLPAQDLCSHHGGL